MKQAGSIRNLIRNQWFLFVLLAVVLFGYAHPGPGVCLRKTAPIQWFIMPTLFLMSFSLPTGAILRGFLNFRGLASSVLGGYALTSVALWLLARAFFPHRQDLALGLIAVGATPCTLASAAIWTRLSGGNDALALAITVVSNLSSFLFSPLILVATLGSAVSPPFQDIMVKLLTTIVLPVGGGQVLRIWAADYADRWKSVLSRLCQVMILLVILIAVSHASETAVRAGEEQGLTGTAVLLLIAAVSVSHLVAFAGCGVLAWMGRAPGGDIVAVMYCGSQKTLPVGIYIVEMLAATRHGEALVFIALPILIYHATQLVIDSFLIEPCRRRVVGDDPTEVTRASALSPTRRAP